MKRIGWMFMVVLGSAVFMVAQSSTEAMHSDKEMKMSGTVCSSACVTSLGSSMTPTCDTSCSVKGDAVLVDDSGNVHKIANPDMCKSHMGKHVKMTAAPMAPTEKEREEKLRVMQLYDDPGGGL